MPSASLRLLISVAALSLCAGVARNAAACSFAAPTEHELDDSEVQVDTAPPEQVGEVTYSIERGQGPEGGCSGTSATSCDDIGRLSLFVTAPKDDRSEAAKLGYVIELVEGTPPLVLPSGAVRSDANGAILLVWTDGASDEQEAIDFTVTLSAVDLAGNVGPASAPIHIRASSRDASGCSVATRQQRGASAWMIVALLAVLRRQGRRR